MLEKKIFFEHVVNRDLTITIKEFTTIDDCGVEISRSAPHTHTLIPGDRYYNEDITTQKLCGILWTIDVIAAYQDKLNDSTDL